MAEDRKAIVEQLQTSQLSIPALIIFEHCDDLCRIFLFEQLICEKFKLLIIKKRHGFKEHKAFFIFYTSSVMAHLGTKIMFWVMWLKIGLPCQAKFE